MEARLNLATGGYNKRASSLLAGINDALNTLDETRLDLGCFRRLKGIEDQAVGRRLAKLQAEVRVRFRLGCGVWSGRGGFVDRF